MITGKRLRIYYMAQVGIEPPTFIFFVNYPNLMTDSYKKYLYNQFREVYAFTGCPLRMFLKGRKRVNKEERNPSYQPQHSASPEEEEEYEEEMGEEFDDEFLDEPTSS
jgi:GTP-binding protein